MVVVPSHVRLGGCCERVNNKGDGAIGDMYMESSEERAMAYDVVDCVWLM